VHKPDAVEAVGSEPPARLDLAARDVGDHGKRGDRRFSPLLPRGSFCGL
jgi:hypothetical protein